MCFERIQNPLNRCRGGVTHHGRARASLGKKETFFTFQAVYSIA